MKSKSFGSHPRSSDVSSEDLVRIILRGDAQHLTELAETIGTNLARQLTTSQIRNVFGTVRQIEMNWGPRATEQERKYAARQLILLKPKLAYQAKRERGKGVQELANVLIPAIDLVGQDRDRFQNFVDFFEAILAYHTAAGGQ
jgi:CRISPR-associated protein Csm2